MALARYSLHIGTPRDGGRRRWRRLQPRAAAQDEPLGRRDAAVAALGTLVSTAAAATALRDRQQQQLHGAAALPHAEVRIAEMVPGSVYAVETAQTFGPVAAPLRAVIMRMRDGRVVLYNSLPGGAATSSLLQLVDQLDCKVAAIIVGSHALEHRSGIPAILKQHPEAQIWSPKGAIWSWPLRLSPWFLGYGRKVYSFEDDSWPWEDELSFAVLRIPTTVGDLVDVAALHKDTGALVVTDALVKHEELARALPLQVEWTKGFRENFDVLSEDLRVPPVMRELVYTGEEEQVAEWARRVAALGHIKYIIPAHFSAPITIDDNRTWQEPFSYLSGEESESGLPVADLRALRVINKLVGSMKISSR